jgi:hypothetical protein
MLPRPDTVGPEVSVLWLMVLACHPDDADPWPGPPPCDVSPTPFVCDRAVAPPDLDVIGQGAFLEVVASETSRSWAPGSAPPAPPPDHLLVAGGGAERIVVVGGVRPDHPDAPLDLRCQWSDSVVQCDEIDALYSGIGTNDSDRWQLTLVADPAGATLSGTLTHQLTTWGPVDDSVYRTQSFAVEARWAVGPGGDDDGDGLPGDLEADHGTDPHRADTDGDGVPDLVDVVRAHALIADCDVDGASDAEEIASDTAACDADWDGDQLSDPDEARCATSAYAYDSDGDEVSDADEVAVGRSPTVFGPGAPVGRAWYLFTPDGHGATAYLSGPFEGRIWTPSGSVPLLDCVRSEVLTECRADHPEPDSAWVFPDDGAGLVQLDQGTHKLLLGVEDACADPSR